MTLTQLKYGLAYVVAGATLTVALWNGTQWYVTQGYMVEVMQGTIERSLAADQPPPNIVEIWTENGTNYAVTNAIGWYVSLSQVTNLASHVRGLVPYYLDTQTMENYTVTGLWASLEIGDRTNLFNIEASPTWFLSQSDLLEIYKVLEKLRTLKIAYAVSADRFSSVAGGGVNGENIVWTNATTSAESNFSFSSPGSIGASFSTIASGIIPTNGGTYIASLSAKTIKPRVEVTWTPDIPANVRILINLQKPSAAIGLYSVTGGVFDAYGTGFVEGWNAYDYTASITGSFYLVSTGSLGRMPSYPGDPIEWCETPSAATGFGVYDGNTSYASARGFQSIAISNIVLLSWQFVYCTNSVVP